MNRTINFPVVGGAADFAIERTDTGYVDKGARGKAYD